MRVLALDTSTEACSVALLDGDTVLLRFALTERSHAELVLPMVESVLEEARLSLRDLQGLAFGRGPGAFTGLRIAAGVVQGYAIGTGLRVVPVSSLAAVAQQVPSRPGERILVCNDARMQEAYWAVFDRNGHGDLQAVTAEGLARPTALDPAVVDARHAAGNALARYPDLRERLQVAGMQIHDGLYPRADAIARLALSEFAAGRAVSAEQALPVYVRDQVAAPGSR
jgi:tRNA threonylcarbamoyladenosine biosynthesis protein TsaB